MVYVHKIFPTPLLQFKFDDHEKYVFDDIPQSVHMPINWSEPLNTSFPEIIDNDQLVSPNVRDDLKADILSCIKKNLRDLNLPDSIDYLNFWYNVYHQGQGQEPHWHLPDIGNVLPYWSGVYYNKNTSPTIFHKDLGIHRLHNFPGYEKSDIKDCVWASYWPEVSDGDILLFPPHLMHSAHMDKTGLMRLTFSFNLIPATKQEIS